MRASSLIFSKSSSIARSSSESLFDIDGTLGIGTCSGSGASELLSTNDGGSSEIVGVDGAVEHTEV